MKEWLIAQRFETIKIISDDESSKNALTSKFQASYLTIPNLKIQTKFQSKNFC